MKQAFVYSLKVWLTAVFLGPIFTIIAAVLGHSITLENIVYRLRLLILNVCMAALISIISWLSLFLCSRSLLKKQLTTNKVKCILTIVALPLTLVPFMLPFAILGFVTDFYYWMELSTYVILIIASIWFYKLKPAS